MLEGQACTGGGWPTRSRDGWCRPINGPLEPLPAPALKPHEHAREIALAARLSGRRGRCSSPTSAALIVAGRVRRAAAAAAEAAHGARLAARSGERDRPARGEAAPAVVTGHRMEGIRACVFDAYGTLFDVHSAVAGGATRSATNSATGRTLLSELWRTKQLEYTWLRALMGRHADFWQVTGEALDYALARTGIEPALREPLLEAYLALDAYPEVRRAAHGCGRAA